MSSISIKLLNLLLEILWLYWVNAQILVGNWTIKISNTSFWKQTQDVVRLKLLFCNNHNLLIYSKKFIFKILSLLSKNVDLVINAGNDSDFFKASLLIKIKDELSNIENSLF